MIKAYIDFWKRAFDFSGRSTRQNTGGLTWVIMLLLLFLLFLCSYSTFSSSVDFSDPALL